jgi:outer membrane receptor for ferrienterochelin and colicins
MTNATTRLGIAVAIILTLQTAALIAGENEKNGSIRGKIIDRQTGQAIPGAHLLVLGTLQGASANSDGSFALHLKSGKYQIEARCLGYRSQQRDIEVDGNDEQQLTFELEPTAIDFPAVVVTGTRNEKAPDDAPVAARVVSNQQIRRAGWTDLRDLLAEQPGLNIAQDFSGNGVQVQGFDPDYTLILLDGSPVIGRTAGTLELTRFAVGNIERVEIVKGPASSLYGSEALAGVINLITRTPRAPLALGLSGKIGEFNAREVATNLEMRRNGLGAYFYFNQNRRDHFDLEPQTVSWTAPEFTDRTFSTKLYWKPAGRAELTLNGRWFDEELRNRVGLSVDNTIISSEDRTDLTDWNISPVLDWQLSSLAKFNGKFYFSRYTVDNELEAQDGSQIFDLSRYDQTYRQAEAQLDLLLSPQHYTKIGGGAIFETLAADRIAQGKRHTHNYIAFAQHEWLPQRALDFVASARVDAHSDYDVHLSPKLAALFKPGDAYQIRASVGGGFKAPTFSQLYLDFTNPQVGYSVFGSTGVDQGMQELVARGEIKELLVDPAAISPLNPESSIAFNVSVDAQPVEFLRLRANLFRNDVNDLIDTQPIARKTNNQFVFSYFNLHRVFTQGLESEAQIDFGKRLELALGYQYVIAKDKEVIERLENGEIYKTGSSGRIRPVVPEEYGGLFNRSRNSGTARLTYKVENGFVFNLRSIVRGRYGLFDLNTNGILDDASEYAAPYALVNLHASYPIAKTFEISAGAENLLDYVDAKSLAGAPGRIIYVRLSLDWKKKG